MQSSKATTVSEYLESLPEDRRKELSKVRSVIKKHIPKGYKETMQYGMIAYVVPLSLDMGKSCVRFKVADDLALEVVGEVVARTPVAAYIERYEAARS